MALLLPLRQLSVARIAAAPVTEVLASASASRSALQPCRPSAGMPWMQVRPFGGYNRPSGPPVQRSTFAPYPMVPYGVKRSAAYRESKKAARKAAERARRSQEEKGMLLDPKKQLRMELKRNTGIGWYRCDQIIKHLEMHERGKGPPMDQDGQVKLWKVTLLNGSCELKGVQSDQLFHS
ncbi:unnamed protein product [Durusdinium trenchii]|uniref:Uncharacterized protein n=1 Tax=Durusdinium trenchii TaxID=1381693 RepID=A0ABP0Q8D2_9DINO